MTTVALETLPAHLQALVREHAAALVSDPTKDTRYRATQRFPGHEVFFALGSDLSIIHSESEIASGS